MFTKEQIDNWCENNLFGDRTVEGISIPLSPTQKAVKEIAIEIILKWEENQKCCNTTQILDMGRWRKD